MNAQKKAMSLAERIKKQKEQVREDRLIIMGVEGVGKTTALLQCPNPFVIACEDGIAKKDKSSANYIIPENWEDVNYLVDKLITEDHNFQTLGIDTLDSMERMIIDHVLERDHHKTLDDYGLYSAGNTIINDEFVKFLKKLDKLQETKKMMVVFTVHTAIKTCNNPAGDNYDRYEYACIKKVSSSALAWVDVSLFATYEIATYKPSKIASAKAVGGKVRIVYTQYQAASTGKTRRDLPEKMIFDMPTILEAIRGKSLDETKELYEEAKDLASRFLPEETRQATLDFLDKNCSNVSVLTKALNRLRYKASKASEKETQTNN